VSLIGWLRRQWQLLAHGYQRLCEHPHGRVVVEVYKHLLMIILALPAVLIVELILKWIHDPMIIVIYWYGVLAIALLLILDLRSRGGGR
jgi:hypothetical protein